jgi:hypothetical protein
METEKLLNELVQRLEKTLPDRLVSVTLYGSGASGDLHRNFSDLNILCVLSAVTPRELAASESIFRWWREKGNPAPLLLSEHEVRTSTDCFPIEFHDMRRQRKVLAGKDVIADIEVDERFYRAQVEFQLRSKLLRLRQKAAGVMSDKPLLRQLLADSLSTFYVLIRHALILRGVDAKMVKRELFDQAAAELGIRPDPFLRLLDLREGKVRERDVDPEALLGDYLSQLGAVIDAVDKLDGNQERE